MLKYVLNALLVVFCANVLFGADAKWIAADDSTVDAPNAWVAFRKDVNLDEVPSSVKAKIAADSKYWLWINGKMAVFEGGLKRGPNPNDGYFDEIDIAPFLKKGENKIAALVWYFGKNGFSHKDSGKFGFFFDAENIGLKSSADWLSRIHPAYDAAMNPPPNARLAESNIKFSAQKDMPDWQNADVVKEFGFKKSKELGEWGCAPWNNGVKRPIPMWKVGEVKSLPFEKIDGNNKDLPMRFPPYVRYVAKLPYNMQMTPTITVSDKIGNNLVLISTDHSVAGGDVNIRAEYVTKKGEQTYESLGWMNGQKIYIDVPRNVVVKEIKYRESGFDAEPSGKFSCDDGFYMTFWDKALRTLYVNMRDNYFDCPERERAQWWGDVVVLMGQTFYTYSTTTHQLMRKAIRELVSWQKPDGAIFSPSPAGNYNSELPGQMLASIGRYGFWNYYMNTGDKDTIKFAYPAVKRYLDTWTLDETGLTAFHKGGWTWGDWGKNRDILMLYAAWHYMALESAANMADVLDLPEDAKEYRAKMEKIKTAFNKCWTGMSYRHPSYHAETDDRVQALAVVSGIADESKYDAIYKFLRKTEHASPYMEKYVMESLFKMGKGEYGLERTRKRFANMINDKEHTTLFEGWEIGGFGGGSTNHAWSGGAVTVISYYLCGLSPLEPAWKTFRIEPNPASFKRASIAVPTVAGEVKSAFAVGKDNFVLDIAVPSGTTAVVYMPEFTKGKKISVNGDSDLSKFAAKKFKHPSKATLSLPAGEYKITAQ